MHERQLTFGPDNYILTNINVWSFDSQWIYCDRRSDAAGELFDCNVILRINANSGEVQTVYRSRNSACVGVVTASQTENKIVFISGPEFPDRDWSYSAYHRQGIILSPGEQLPPTILDARDIVAPFTPGALRGGTHLHVFSGDGLWVSFTYEDHILATSQSPTAQQNQRNVGVSLPSRPVSVPKTHPRNHDGSRFSFLVTTTCDGPVPGSDQINRAYEESWIGVRGYIHKDGSRQERALAFVGDCISEGGKLVNELFVVDLPSDMDQASCQQLCGTETTRPAPPTGTKQRRLTWSARRKYPGLCKPRHWPRSSADGRRIAFLMSDDNGLAQLWTISPLGVELKQLTQGAEPIASAFSFRNDGEKIACVIGNQVCEVDAASGEVTKLTSPDCSFGATRPEACVYSPDGKYIAFARSVRFADGLRNQIFTVESTL